MCSIAGFYCRESVPDFEALSRFLKHGEKRGTDGFGLYVGNQNLQYVCKRVADLPSDYYKFIEDMGFRHDNYGDYLGAVLIANHRAAPETESNVDPEKINTTIQPIVTGGCAIAHNGSVSNFILRELEAEGYIKTTEIDSEYIIFAYHKHGFNMKATMEYLSGGFSFLLHDCHKNKLYVVCTHNPLYCGYVKGYGLFFHSVEEAVWDMISELKGSHIDKNTYNIWEDYYCHSVQEHSIMEIDLESGMVNHHSFTPRYKHPKYDPLTRESKDRVVTLVSSSGGLDSSTTLAVLKEAGMNPIAVNFDYGHRGQHAESIASSAVAKELDIPYIKFSINDMYKIDNFSMLTNTNHEITTGTDIALKTTAAWSCFRNVFFLTYMGAYAESLILQDIADTVYYTGGFMNLSESGAYPDNSERFVKAFDKLCKFGSITSDKIKPLYGLCNILKTEQYVILNELGLYDKLGPWLISCDRPTVVTTLDGAENHPLNCSFFNKETNQMEPACGSGRLSWWACQKAGLKDNRRYYPIDSEYNAFNKKIEKNDKTFKIDTIIGKLEIPEKYKENLKKKIK